jgi:GT2 family glycosyltransferase
MTIKIAIGIATAGRKEVLSETIGVIARQSRMADELMICPAKDDDLDPRCLDDYPGRFRVCKGPVGLTSQRNALIEATDADVLVFFDDDFLPSRDYLKEVESIFLANEKVVVATGKVLADGITGPGLDYDEGMRILESAGRNLESSLLRTTYNGYGCNMAVRMHPVREHGLRFDERLPLYGWLEDLDFSRQIARHGEIVDVDRLRGVHLGTKRSGRSPGRRLGYSQVANPVYLARKGTMHWKRALTQIGRNLAANLTRSVAPEPWVDRRGRLAGNLRAIGDLAVGKISPEQALKV